MVSKLLQSGRHYEHNAKSEIFGQMVHAIDQMEDPFDLMESARLFNEFLNLVNLAEKLHRLRRYVLGDPPGFFVLKLD